MSCALYCQNENVSGSSWELLSFHGMRRILFLAVSALIEVPHVDKTSKLRDDLRVF